MMTCPSCQSTERQVKNGRTRSGSQRYWCRPCGRKYSPQAKDHRYPLAMRHTAVQLYVDGMNLRRIARQLGVVHQTVANWVAAHAAALPATPPGPPTVHTAELVTFIGSKKTPPMS